MVKKKAVVLGAAVFVGLLCAGCGGPAVDTAGPEPGEDAAEVPAVEDEAAKALLDTRCTKCHPFGKIEAYAGDESWPEIVTRMIDLRGAEIDPADKETIIGYLEKTYGQQ